MPSEAKVNVEPFASLIVYEPVMSDSVIEVSVLFSSELLSLSEQEVCFKV